jgi:hypothetical protein
MRNQTQDTALKAVASDVIICVLISVRSRKRQYRILKDALMSFQDFRSVKNEKRRDT